MNCENKELCRRRIRPSRNANSTIGCKTKYRITSKQIVYNKGTIYEATRYTIYRDSTGGRFSAPDCGCSTRIGINGFCFIMTMPVFMLEVQGTEKALAKFVDAVKERKGPIARIDSVKAYEIPLKEDSLFVIAPSPAGKQPATFIGADTAPCKACRRELHDPMNRRFHYGLY